MCCRKALSKYFARNEDKVKEDLLFALYVETGLSYYSFGLVSMFWESSGNFFA